MITSFDLWQKFIGRANTHQGGPVKPNRNFIDWVNDISLEIFEEEYDVWQKTQIITDRLNPFLQSVNVAITPVPSQMWDVIVQPSDYAHFSSARLIRYNGESCGLRSLPTFDCNGKLSNCPVYMDADELALLKRDNDAAITELGITKVTNNRWASIMKHRRLHPKADAPICTQYKGGIKIAPKGLGIVVIDYLTLPVKATFDYTIVNPGLETEYIQYNAGTSTPLEWSALMVNEFINRLLKNYGTFTREQMIYEHASVDLQRSS